MDCFVLRMSSSSMLAFRACRAAYRRLAYQLFRLVLDALRQVAAPVITLGALADRALADALFARDLPMALDAGPVTQLNALPVLLAAQAVELAI